MDIGQHGKDTVDIGHDLGSFHWRSSCSLLLELSILTCVGPAPCRLPAYSPSLKSDPSVHTIPLPTRFPFFIRVSWARWPKSAQQLVPPSIKTWGERIASITCQLISACGPAKFGDVLYFCAKCQLLVKPSSGLLYSLVFLRSVCQVRLLAGNITQKAAQKYDSTYSDSHRGH